MSNILQQVQTAINSVYKDKPIVGQIAMAQAILESNLFHGGSVLALKYNNLFGIKGTGTQGTMSFPTHEFIKGPNPDKDHWVTIPQNFAWNKTLEDSVLQHRHLMQLPRYTNVWNSLTFQDACVNIWKDGYATDPKYPTLLESVYQQYQHMENL